jgi:hypothetical protein
MSLNTEHPYWLEIKAYFDDNKLHLNPSLWMGSIMSYTPDHLAKIMDLCELTDWVKQHIVNILLTRQRLYITGGYTTYTLADGKKIIAVTPEEYVAKLDELAIAWRLDYTKYDCLGWCMDVKNTPIEVYEYLLNLGLKFNESHLAKIYGVSYSVLKLMAQHVDSEELICEYLRSAIPSYVIYNMQELYDQISAMGHISNKCKDKVIKLMISQLSGRDTDEFIAKLDELGCIWNIDFAQHDCLGMCMNNHETVPLPVYKYFIDSGLQFEKCHIEKARNASRELIILMAENGIDINDIACKYIKTELAADVFGKLKLFASLDVDLTSCLASV